MAVRDIQIKESGEGRPVVLVHGFPLDGRVWDGVAGELSKQFHVIVPDLPGFGRSTAPMGLSFTIEALADDLHAALTKLKTGPVALAGLSMGGYVALAYAKKYARDLLGLILVDTKSAADTDEAKAGRDKMIALANEKGSTAVAEQMLPKMLAPATLESRPETVACLKEIMHACPAPTIAAACAAMRDREDYTAVLDSFDLPALILVGRHDAITPPALAEAMKNSAPAATLAVIEGAGHMSPVEQPQSVAGAIARWMK